MGKGKDIKQGIKDKFSGFLHPTWRTMHQYFLRQTQHSSFNDCQHCWHMKNRTQNQNKTHKCLLVSSILKMNPLELGLASQTFFFSPIPLFLWMLPNLALSLLTFCLLRFWVLRSSNKIHSNKNLNVNMFPQLQPNIVSDTLKKKNNFQRIGLKNFTTPCPLLQSVNTVMDGLLLFSGVLLSLIGI